MKTLTRSSIKPCVLLAMAALSGYSGLSLTQATQPVTPTERMTYRNNQVYLQIKTPGYKLLGGQYDTYARSITSGQDPEGRNNPPQTYDVSGHDGSISFNVGRKGSEQVADWFSSHLGASSNTFGDSPGKLNFAFAGNLALAIQGPGLNPDTPVLLPDIFFAQGRKVLANNWWFGGLQCKRAPGFIDQASCRSSSHPSITFTFVRGYTDMGPHGKPLANASEEVYLYIQP